MLTLFPQAIHQQQCREGNGGGALWSLHRPRDRWDPTVGRLGEMEVREDEDPTVSMWNRGVNVIKVHIILLYIILYYKASAAKSFFLHKTISRMYIFLSDEVCVICQNTHFWKHWSDRFLPWQVNNPITSSIFICDSDLHLPTCHTSYTFLIVSSGHLCHSFRSIFLQRHP